MTIKYTAHLNQRIIDRRIPPSLPRRIYKSSNERYRDNWQDSLIAVGTNVNRGLTTFYMIAYIMGINNNVTIKTIHPILPSQIKARVQNGRWTRI